MDFKNENFKRHYLRKVKELEGLINDRFVRLDWADPYMYEVEPLWAEATALILVAAAVGDKELMSFGIAIKDLINHGHEMLLDRWGLKSV